MIKLIIHLLYLIIILNTQCYGKKVEVKIKDDWEEKREFNHLKKFTLQERFVLKIIGKYNNRYCSNKYDTKRNMRSIELEHDRNTFKVEIYDRSVFTASVQLKRRILIEIVNNEIIQRFLPEFEKQVFFIILFQFKNLN